MRCDLRRCLVGWYLLFQKLVITQAWLYYYSLEYLTHLESNPRTVGANTNFSFDWK